jgi:hypothetical protein
MSETVEYMSGDGGGPTAHHVAGQFVTTIFLGRDALGVWDMDRQRLSADRHLTNPAKSAREVTSLLILKETRGGIGLQPKVTGRRDLADGVLIVRSRRLDQWFTGATPPRRSDATPWTGNTGPCGC